MGAAVYDAGVGKRLYALLEPLGLYRLRQDSLVDAELAAYLAAFALVEARLEELEAQAFVQTAYGEGLVRHEKLVGLQERSLVDTGVRRELVIYRLSTSPYDFTLEGMVRSVRAAGLEARITENPAAESLTLVALRLIDEFTDLDAVKASVATMLPAHLGPEYDIGILTWDMFDRSDPAWDDWDNHDFTWNEFDLDGHNIFTGGGGPDA